MDVMLDSFDFIAVNHVTWFNLSIFSLTALCCAIVYVTKGPVAPDGIPYDINHTQWDYFTDHYSPVVMIAFAPVILFFFSFGYNLGWLYLQWIKDLKEQDTLEWMFEYWSYAAAVYEVELREKAALELLIKNAKANEVVIGPWERLWDSWYSTIIHIWQSPYNTWGVLISICLLLFFYIVYVFGDDI